MLSMSRKTKSAQQAGSDWADRELARLAAGLRAKRETAINYLGEKWILHPVHTRSKLDVGPNALGKMV